MFGKFSGSKLPIRQTGCSSVISDTKPKVALYDCGETDFCDREAGIMRSPTDLVDEATRVLLR